MRSILEKIYTTWLFDKEKHKEMTDDEKREVEGFEELTTILKDSDLSKFISYTDILDELYRCEKEQAFQDGFVIGVLLMIEIFNKKAQ